ncbi:MAG TPA: hypothetical protein VF097_11765 [Actinomycetota bacterium]
MRLPIPSSVRRRMEPYKERADDFLRRWEWTWTSAFIAGLIISFIAMTTLVVIPSWFLFFANQTLGWSTADRLLVVIRDSITMGWITVWTVAFIFVAYKVQVHRRRLRGERQAERYSGGYR